MNPELGPEAAQYGREALRAFEAAGGDELVRRAERWPERRARLVEPVLAELGAFELDPRGDPEELAAAAALCRSAGHFALPYPVAERLARPADGTADGLLVVAGAAPSGAVAGLKLRWTAVTLDGRRHDVVGRPLDAPPRDTAFVTGLDLIPVDAPSPANPAAADVSADPAGDVAADLALGLVLPCWTLLGMLDRVIELTRAHVLVREQFGRPLARLQAIQFQLTDAAVERDGVEVLARYALWAVHARPDDAVDDALALRLAAAEAAETVFRVAHQLHGAIGFCDEATLSWLSRHSQPLRRLPLGLSATRALLTERLGRIGLRADWDPR